MSKNIKSYFEPCSKKVKFNFIYESHEENNNSQLSLDVKHGTLNPGTKEKNSFLPVLKSDSSKNDSDCKMDLDLQSLKWKKISAENLNLEYVRLFARSVADEIFQRLEEEVEYFTGNLLKVQIFGKWHQIPRKQVSYGDPGLTYKFSGNCIPALPWTPLTLELKQYVERATHQEFNFVLINRYKDGEDYMGEHRDDEKDLVADAPIASLSFGQARDFIFRHKDSRGAKATRKIDPVKLVLEHGSLLIMRTPTNNFWYHSLPVRKKAINVRVNLTFRKMVSKNIAKKTVV